MSEIRAAIAFLTRIPVGHAGLDQLAWLPYVTPEGTSRNRGLVRVGGFKRRAGGLTGDFLGATQQVGELAFLLGASFACTSSR